MVTNYGDGTFESVAPGSDEETQVQTAINALIGEIMPNCLDEITSAILSVRDAILTQSCCTPIGEPDTTETGSSEETPPPAIGGIVFEDHTTIDYKCGVANVIVETLLSSFTALSAYPIDTWVGYGLVLAVGIATTVLAAIATPVIALIIGVAGAIVAFAVKMITSEWDIDNVVTVLTDSGQDLVCALYESEDTSEARGSFILACEDGGMTAVEAEIVSLLLTNGVLANLFWTTPEMTTYLDSYTPPYDCNCGATCALSFLQHATAGSMGSGSLLADGNPRTLTAVQNPDNGWYYIIFQVGPPTTSYGYNTCALVDPDCYGVSDYYIVTVNSATETITANASECDAGTPGITLSGGSTTPLGPINVSYIEIYNTTTPFTASVTISPRT